MAELLEKTALEMLWYSDVCLTVFYLLFLFVFLKNYLTKLYCGVII